MFVSSSSVRDSGTRTSFGGTSVANFGQLCWGWRTDVALQRMIRISSFSLFLMCSKMQNHCGWMQVDATRNPNQVDSLVLNDLERYRKYMQKYAESIAGAIENWLTQGENQPRDAIPAKEEASRRRNPWRKHPEQATSCTSECLDRALHILWIPMIFDDILWYLDIFADVWMCLMIFHDIAIYFKSMFPYPSIKWEGWASP